MQAIMASSDDRPTLSSLLADGTLVDGRYRIDRLVSRTEMAEVYRGEDVALRRPVAIKIRLRPTAGAAERFSREVSLLGRQSHPNIVRIFDHGETRGVPYQVIEWIEGETLRDLLQREGRLAWQRAVEILAPIADALSYAHALGFLHRDLKPSNILLATSTPGLPVPKLTDFGAIGELIGGSQPDEGVTRAGFVIGTPTYMAPEQLTGASHTPATDVFGLGIVLLEMLFGAVAQPDSMQAIVKRLTQAIEIPPTPPIPDELRKILTDMLRSRMEERPQSAAEVRDALLRVNTSSAPSAAAAARRSPHVAAAWRHTLSASSRRMIVYAAVAALATVSVALLLWASGGDVIERLRHGPLATGVRGIALGLSLIAIGILAGAALTRGLMRRRSALESDAGKLLLGTQDRRALTQTLVVELEVLVARVKEIDARILGITIVQMIREYETAQGSPDRQAALMNAVNLLKQFMEHLSPWYVRHARAVGVAVSVIGAVSGLVKIVDEVTKIGR